MTTLSIPQIHPGETSEKELRDFFEFLRFQSVSTDPSRHRFCQECANWVSNYLMTCGLDSEVRFTEGLPVVIAKNELRPDRPTVLVYGHYDVQPEDPLALWKNPPFEPHLENGVVYARGATDNKGQIFSHMLGMRRMISQSATLPLNVIFLIEGEEEIGSPHLADFLTANRDELQCDAVIVSDTGMVSLNRPTLTYGLRGIAALELKISGPVRDLHSGIFGGAVLNPLVALCKVIASLHDKEGRVTIPGFYEGIRKIQDWERQAWSTLPLNETEILKLTGSPKLWGESGYSPLERMWTRPTAEVNGIYGGYQGPGSKTIIPAEATAKLTFRLVPHQSPQKVLDAASDFIQTLCPSGCKIEITRGHMGEAYYLDPLGPLGQIATAALQAVNPDPAGTPALICEGGSVPIVADFKKILGADTILVGMALPDCRIHSPNENFPLALLDYGARLHRELLTRLASLR